MKRNPATRDGVGRKTKRPADGARSKPGAPASLPPPGEPPPANLSSSGRFHLRDHPRVLGWLLFLSVLAVFLSTLRHEFICYDDNGYVTQNRWLKNGFTWANIVHAFHTTEVAYWHPLTWMSHLLDVELFGLQPWGHHLTSVLLHAANAVLLFVVLRRMTGATWRSWIVAALFGLHPLHVESVAWVAERKDVLSTLFWLLAVWSYAEWVGRKGARRPRALWFYALALLSFAAGLMSKPMVVTLPCVLLLLDYWPLNRLGRRTGDARGDTFGSLLAEKIPFFALSVAASLATIKAQANLGTLQTVAQYSLTTRVVNALVSYFGYLEKCFVPAKLAVFYPYPESLPVGLALISGVILIGVTIAAVVWRGRRPYLLAGWLWYLGILVPVIGLVQVGGQAMADRYSYVSLVGIFIMLVWTVEEATRGWERRSLLRVPATAAVLVSLAALTNRQLGFWQDSPTLFRHALAVTERNWCAHSCLGYYYAQTPDGMSEAISEYRETVKLAPTLVDGHYSLGALLARTPDGLNEAISEYRAALRLDPRYAQAHVGLAQIFGKVPGRLAEAIAEGQTAVRLDPGNPDAQISLAFALSRAPGRLTEAVAQYRVAAKLEPNSAAVHFSLGSVLARTGGDLPEAVAEYQTALRLDSSYLPARLALGKALTQIPGRLDQAVAECERTVQLLPDNPDAHLDLGDALAQLPGRWVDAIAEYRTVLRLRPDWVEVHSDLGIVLSQIPGRLPEAIAEYEAVIRAKPGFAEAHNNLANLLAQIPGRSAETIAEYEMAFRLRPDYYEAHFNLGQFLRNFPERRPEAIAQFEEALKINPALEAARAMLDRLRSSSLR